MSKTNAEINVTVTFRHTDATEALKTFVTDKLVQCIKKYVNHNTDVRAVLSVEKRDHSVEVHIRSKGFEISAKEVTDDLYSATDAVVDNLHAQLRKQKERMTQRAAKAANAASILET